MLSLGASHRFALAEVADYLHSASVRQVLTQALLAAPMFATRWRWNASIALALPRARAGKMIPTQLQRMIAEDLLASVFPDQLACAENILGDLEIPDDPLVQQTLRDCLAVAMDADGLEHVLAEKEAGRVRVIAKDVTEPSPLAMEILVARPYAFLDDAPLEERRTQAVIGRRWLDPDGVTDLGRLDEDAITRVRAEAWPSAETPDELHDALLWLCALTEGELRAGPGWSALAKQLIDQGRATRLSFSADGPTLWIAAERLPLWQTLFPQALAEPELVVPPEYAAVAWERAAAFVEIVRGRLEGSGPVSATRIARTLGLPPAEVDAALVRLGAEGFVMRGSFTPALAETEWCERRLLARIHRYTVKRLRAEIELVSAADCMRFLFHWQRPTPQSRMSGPDAVAATIGMNEGFEAPAAAWETEILPARVNDYEPEWLDDLCLKGRAAWMRLSRPRTDPVSGQAAGPVRVTPITLLTRRNVGLFVGERVAILEQGGELIALSGADPLNLAGVLTPGPKVAALSGNRVLYRDGAPNAWLAGGTVSFAESLASAERHEAHNTLIRRHPLAPTLSFLG